MSCKNGFIREILLFLCLQKSEICANVLGPTRIDNKLQPNSPESTGVRTLVGRCRCRTRALSLHPSNNHSHNPYGTHKQPVVRHRNRTASPFTHTVYPPVTRAFSPPPSSSFQLASFPSQSPLLLLASSSATSNAAFQI